MLFFPCKGLNRFHTQTATHYFCKVRGIYLLQPVCPSIAAGDPP